MAELIPVAQQWQEKNQKAKMPVITSVRNGCTVRGGKPACRSLRIPGELPIYTADNLLLQWSKRHCPDYFAL